MDPALSMHIYPPSDKRRQSVMAVLAMVVYLVELAGLFWGQSGEASV